uniref:S8 family serine peptidase n=1 Tax=Prevotella sp. GTC17262 TaxID=3236797 RepID=A0AB33JIC7_9BACT
MVIMMITSLQTAAKGYESHKVSYPGGKCFMFRVSFTDKQGTQFTIHHPEDFLSPRAIMRRQQQHIAIDSTDLPVSQAYIQVLRKHRLEIVGKSKWNNSVLVRCDKVSQIDCLKSLPFIRDIRHVFSSPDSIEPSQRVNFKKDFNRWDTLSHNPYGMAEDQIKALNGIQMHRAGYTGKGKVIAVLDAGFMNVDKIPVLHGIKLAGLADFVVPRSRDIFSELDHGTMVLSTMAANQAGAYKGTAPDASYILIRCEDQYTESLAEEDYWAQAVEYADSAGVDVINSSLGFHDFDDRTTNHTYQELDGQQTLISHTASMLAGKGIVLVNSAGNDGMGTWKKINFPADATDILTVGSISPNGLNAAFSAVGPTADGRIKPDVMAYGSPTTVISGRGTIINDMGTSFSAPLIAGMTACLWQALPNKTALEIIDLIRKSGNNSLHPNTIMGYGVPDFWKAFQAGK